jgi:hypothetical protein
MSQLLIRGMAHLGAGRFGMEVGRRGYSRKDGRAFHDKLCSGLACDHRWTLGEEKEFKVERGPPGS